MKLLGVLLVLMLEVAYNSKKGKVPMINIFSLFIMSGKQDYAGKGRFSFRCRPAAQPVAVLWSLMGHSGFLKWETHSVHFYLDVWGHVTALAGGLQNLPPATYQVLLGTP